MPDDSPHRRWYERIGSEQGGYRESWSSTKEGRSGEDAFEELLERLLTPDMVVLDVGCSGGSFTLGTEMYKMRCVLYNDHGGPSMPQPANPRAYDISSSELRERLADVMKDVEQGATVTVTRYGRAVLRITPAVEVNADLDFSAVRATMPRIGDEAQRILREQRDSF